MKIRGTAAHVAEKYMSLARDALASGDLVMAESYLQHAEHYNRIIMAAQSQLGPQGSPQAEGPNGGGGYRQSTRWHSDEEGADDDEGGGAEIRTGSGGGDIRGGGGQDRERHTGDREHHGGGREHGRHGGNGREGTRDANGADEPEAQPSDEPAPDTTVS